MFPTETVISLFLQERDLSQNLVDERPPTHPAGVAVFLSPNSRFLFVFSQQRFSPVWPVASSLPVYWSPPLWCYNWSYRCPGYRRHLATSCLFPEKKKRVWTVPETQLASGYVHIPLLIFKAVISSPADLPFNKAKGSKAAILFTLLRRFLLVSLRFPQDFSELQTSFNPRFYSLLYIINNLWGRFPAARRAGAPDTWWIAPLLHRRVCFQCKLSLSCVKACVRVWNWCRRRDLSVRGICSHIINGKYRSSGWTSEPAGTNKPLGEGKMVVVDWKRRQKLQTGTTVVACFLLLEGWHLQND